MGLWLETKPSTQHLGLETLDIQCPWAIRGIGCSPTRSGRVGTLRKACWDDSQRMGGLIRSWDMCSLGHVAHQQTVHQSRGGDA
jgi:hypothetical protein